MAQHGAAVSEEYPDADGEIVEALARSSARTSRSASLPDMHANLSQKLIDNATITVVYRTNPHLDPKERAEECAELIVRTIEGEIRPVQALEMPPLVVNIVKQYTGEDPMKAIVAGIPEVLGRPGILSASVAEGYPYADVEEMGMAFLAIHDGDLLSRPRGRPLPRRPRLGAAPGPPGRRPVPDRGAPGRRRRPRGADRADGRRRQHRRRIVGRLDVSRWPTPSGSASEATSRPSTIPRPSPPARRPASAPRSRCPSAARLTTFTAIP